mmetsp:Transcript_12241/g.18962  ORF Transcript_12241/g.18962 Transcript_12241/m.18962 type:complete len:114 (+) Transcript_12241:272-613(+)
MEAPVHKVKSDEKADVDSIDWTLTGRFACYAISKKRTGNELNKETSASTVKKEAVVHVKAFDTVTGKETIDLTRTLKEKCYNFASVIKAHPQVEHQLFASFDGGITVVFDLFQ